MRKVTLDGAISYLARAYGRALTDTRIHKPVSWALYQTWKRMNELEVPRDYKGGRRG